MSAHSKTKTSSGNCGCSDTAIPTRSTCGCGGAGCSLCENKGLVRPRFFAGQLLTEEDLQLLTDYTVAKNRLHNRYLFGEGVVCGLEVTCHPCGGGTVLVHPGYALDCCGNDILVQCEKELDINAMVRDLRRNLLGGYDCGDPCADKKKEKEGEAGHAGTETKAVKYEDVLRHYCLYVRYCEELSDPVSPYATAEPCGVQSCEATRVREGFRFELRCQEDPKPHQDLFTSIAECLGDLVSTDRLVSGSLSLGRFSRQSELADAAIKANPVAQFSASHVETLRTETERLSTLLSEHKGREWSEENAWEAVNSARTISSNVARFYTLPAGEQRKWESAPVAAASTDLADERRSVSADEVLRRATSVLAGLRPLIQPAVAQITTDYDREYAMAVVDNAEEIATTNERVNAVAHRNLAEGFIVTNRYRARTAEELCALREALLDLLEKSDHLTDCSLPKFVRSISIAECVDAKTGTSTRSDLANDAKKLQEALIRYLRECICLALNPVCQPCDDTGVLLACLDVKDCDVIRICNIERTFVISGVSVRYWVPLLRLLGEALERFCCLPPKCGVEEDRTAVEPPSRATGAAPETVHRVFAATGGVSPREVDPLYRVVLGTYSLLGEGRIPALTGLVAKPPIDIGFPKTDIERRVSLVEKQIDNVFTRQEAPAAITTAVDNRIVPLERRFAEDIEKLPTREQVDSVVETRVNGALANVVTRDKLDAAITTAVDPKLATLNNKVTASLARVPAREEVDAAGAAVDTRIGGLEGRLTTGFAKVMTREESEAAISSAVEVRVAAAETRFNAAIAKLSTREETAALVDTRMSAALNKAKVSTIARDVKELKRLKRDHATLEKKVSILDERLKKTEG
jgi:hypothetical protein